MDESFKAIVADERDGKVAGELVDWSLDRLPDLPVLVDVDFSTLNYKDGLAVTGAGKIARKTPLVCGIDLAGVVSQSTHAEWPEGEAVLVNGYGLSETQHGGYTQRQRLNPDWLVRLPSVFSAKEAMAIGTAGYTAMLCVQAIEDHGVVPGDGPVLVTGASGGVGSTAIMLLSALGYQVVAASGRVADNEAFLKGLGAMRVIDREELSKEARPLEKETWAAAVDSVGGTTLATVLAQTSYEGVVSACGLAGGAGLKSTVMPFILRGVTLRGIDSVMASQERRQKAWDRLADLVDKSKLKDIYAVHAMSELPTLAEELLAGKVRGRIVIDVNR